MQNTLRWLLVACCLCSPVHAETIVLVADNWCPYNCASDSDKPGFMVEVAKKAFSRHGIDVEYKTMPWARAIEETRNTIYTGIIGASKGDAPDFVFPTVPQGTMKNGFYVLHNNSWRYTGVKSLAAVSLGVIYNYTYGEILDGYIKKNKSNMRLVQSVHGDNALEINIKKLQRKRIGALVEDMHVMDYFLAQRQLEGTIVLAGTLPESPDSPLFIAFSPNNSNAKKYAEILSQETEAMKKSGEFSEIMKTYSITE